MRSMNFIVVGAAFLGFGIVLIGGTDQVQAAKTKMYSTKVTKITEAKDHMWLIQGTTKAPNKSKIMLTPTKKSNFDYGDQEGQSTATGEYAKVKNGKFKVKADPIDIENAETGKTGQKTPVAIFATTYVKGDWTSSNLPKNWKSKHFKRTTLTMSATQATYMNDDSDSGSSGSKVSSSSSSTETNSYMTVSYDQLARTPDQYENKEVKISGYVMQVEKDDGMTMLLVCQNDDPDSIIMIGMDNSYKPANGNILEDDEVTVYGSASGTQKYTTTLGDKNEVPMIIADAKVLDSGETSYGN